MGGGGVCARRGAIKSRVAMMTIAAPARREQVTGLRDAVICSLNSELSTLNYLVRSILYPAAGGNILLERVLDLAHFGHQVGGGNDLGFGIAAG